MFRLMFFGFKSEIEKLLEILKIKKRVENEPKWDSKQGFEVCSDVNNFVL